MDFHNKLDQLKKEEQNLEGEIARVRGDQDKIRKEGERRIMLLGKEIRDKIKNLDGRIRSSEERLERDRREEAHLLQEMQHHEQHRLNESRRAGDSH
jgi:hypothetical protein